ncbi:hypothetical protein LY78DRAFT_135109 [Colletotrichum sublineola]|nr:hypothetical protein LY78DRAFT_135109 [Colletotrichum sublineola]
MRECPLLAWPNGNRAHCRWVSHPPNVSLRCYLYTVVGSFVSFGSLQPGLVGLCVQYSPTRWTTTPHLQACCCIPDKCPASGGLLRRRHALGFLVWGKWLYDVHICRVAVPAERPGLLVLAAAAVARTATRLSATV